MGGKLRQTSRQMARWPHLHMWWWYGDLSSLSSWLDQQFLYSNYPYTNPTEVFPSDISLGMTIKSICFRKALLPGKLERKPVCMQYHTATFCKKRKRTIVKASLRFPLIRRAHPFPAVNSETDTHFKIYPVIKTIYNKISH